MEKEKSMTHWVLVTGGIGSGKTTVSDLFAALGVPVLDTDVISRELTAPGGAAIPALEEAFGRGAITARGALNRDWMREQIFTDPILKKKLEGILHPLILKIVEERMQEIQAPYGLIVVPVFSASSPYNAIVDRILVIDADEKTQLLRVKNRSGLDSESVEKIIKTQLTRTERLALQDDIIENNQDVKHLEKEVARLNQYYLTLFQ